MSYSHLFCVIHNQHPYLRFSLVSVCVFVKPLLLSSLCVVMCSMGYCLYIFWSSSDSSFHGFGFLLHVHLIKSAIASPASYIIWHPEFSYVKLCLSPTDGWQIKGKIWITEQKNTACRCFTTGVQNDRIKQLTSYHALWYIRKCWTVPADLYFRLRLQEKKGLSDFELGFIIGVWIAGAWLCINRNANLTSAFRSMRKASESIYLRSRYSIIMRLEH